MSKQRQFLVDENLLGLVKWLRLMGVDATVSLGASDNSLRELARSEGRILLTKDRRFFQRLSSEEAYFVQSQKPREQLLEVLRAFPLRPEEEPLSRCFKCNTLIEPIAKDLIRHRVDAKTFSLFDKFYECPTCHNIYWEGSHFDKLQREILKIRSSLGEDAESV